MALAVPALPFTFIAHFLGIALIVLVLVWNIHFRGGLAWDSSNKSLIFNLHPVLMLIGLIVIGGEGSHPNPCEHIKFLLRRNGLLIFPCLQKRLKLEKNLTIAAIISYKSLLLKKEVKKVIHLVLHAIAIALGIIGIYLAFKFHNESGIANLYSLHSWLGIAVIVLYCIQWLYGFLTFFFPGGSQFLRQESLPWHVMFGLIVYVLAVGTATLGFLEKLTFLENSGLAKYGAEALLVNFTAVITVLFGAFVVLTVLSQGPTAEDDYSAI